MAGQWLPQPEKAERKRGSGAAGILLIAFFLLLGLAAGVGWLVMTPFGPSTETFVDVAPGTGGVRIGRMLESAGIVRSRYAFDLVRSWKRGTLRAGEYRFDHPLTVIEVYSQIERGDVYTKTLTVPEGSSMFDIAARVEQAGFGTQQEFLVAARHGPPWSPIWIRRPRASKATCFRTRIIFPGQQRRHRLRSPW